MEKQRVRWLYVLLSHRRRMNYRPRDGCQRDHPFWGLWESTTDDLSPTGKVPGARPWYAKQTNRCSTDSDRQGHRHPGVDVSPRQENEPEPESSSFLYEKKSCAWREWLDWISPAAFLQRSRVEPTSRVALHATLAGTTVCASPPRWYNREKCGRRH